MNTAEKPVNKYKLNLKNIFDAHVKADGARARKLNFLKK